MSLLNQNPIQLLTGRQSRRSQEGCNQFWSDHSRVEGLCDSAHCCRLLPVQEEDSSSRLRLCYGNPVAALARLCSGSPVALVRLLAAGCNWLGS